jgi:hypothetical protein
VRQVIWITALFAAAHIAGGAVSADLMGYVATNTPDSVVYLVDFDEGEVSPLEPSGVPFIHALEYVDGVLYAAAGQNGNHALWKIDTATGLGTPIGSTDLWVNSLAATHDGVMYGGARFEDNDKLLLIDTTTGADSVVGPLTPFVGMQALAINDDGFAVGWDYASTWLFRISLSDGSTTSLGALPGLANFQAFDFASDGTLYGLEGNRLYTIDTTLPTATLVRTLPSPASDSLTFLLEPGPPLILGDINDDGEVNGLDVDPFVDVLLASRFDVAADMNGDGAVNGLDVDPFVDAVVGGGAATVPEPSTFLLCILTIGLLRGQQIRIGFFPVEEK